jgi:predicted MFS family arabinose efflux permease
MRRLKNVIVLVAFLSDHLKLRGTLMLFTLPFAIIGYAVIANTSNSQVGYGMTFLMSTGLYASVPCVLVWNSNNSAGHYKRATTSAMQLAIANCGGFVATFIYPAKDAASLYHRGHTVVLSLLVAAWFLYALPIPAVTRDELANEDRILFNVLYCRKVNKDKANGKYDKYVGYNDDRDPKFVFIL